MEKINNVSEFVFWGLSQNPEVEEICFVVFSLFYTVILLGNLLIMLTVCMGNLFKSPMYFFLSYLSFVDICYSSVTAPKMIVDLLAKRSEFHKKTNLQRSTFLNYLKHSWPYSGGKMWACVSVSVSKIRHIFPERKMLPYP